MSLSIVTSFNRAIWYNHGKTCISSWEEHIKGAYELHLYIDGPIPSDLPKGDNIHIHWLDNEPEYVKFLTETRDVTPNPSIPPEHKFRFEFRRFWPKVRSIYDAALAQHRSLTLPSPDGGSAIHANAVSVTGPILWLDADILFKKDISVDRILEDLKDNQTVVCLDRGHPWNYMDSGYLLFDPTFLDAFQFVESLYNIYTTKTLFRFTEWHDAFLMSQVMNILWGDDKGNFVKSLSGMSSSLHPLDDSWLRDYMVHLKGGLKHGVTQSFEGQEIEKQNALAPIEAPRRTDV